MASFTSTYPVAVDGKGRVVLPAPFKKEMGDGLDMVYVVEKDVYEHFLNINPLSAWDAKEEPLRKRLNMDDPIHSKMLSRIYEEIVKVSMAENCILIIAEELLKYAGIV